LQAQLSFKNNNFFQFFLIDSRVIKIIKQKISKRYVSFEFFINNLYKYNKLLKHVIHSNLTFYIVMLMYKTLIIETVIDIDTFCVHLELFNFTRHNIQD
jgi:hypothetical protein